MLTRILPRSSLRTTARSHLKPAFRSAAIRPTTTATMTMEEPIEKMREADVPKAAEPSSAAMPSEGEQTLPKLSSQEFKVYNNMAENMDMFHNHFRQTWNTLYSACVANKRPTGMSIRQFLSLASEFCHHLTLHHTIEERHIFPVLAKKMTYFSPKEHLLTQHAGIHRGIDVLEGYVQQVKEGGKEFNLRELKVVLDGFGEMLWKHLEDEVRMLGAENMRKYWTVEEMSRMPM